MTKKYNISRELINAVLNEDIKDIYFAPNGRFFETWNEERDDRVNTNDFFFMCKEWASRKGYILFSKTRLNSSLASCYFDVMGLHDYEDDFKNDFRAESEQQAVFDACQWILENKRN